MEDFLALEKARSWADRPGRSSIAAAGMNVVLALEVLDYTSWIVVAGCTHDSDRSEVASHLIDCRSSVPFH